MSLFKKNPEKQTTACSCNASCSNDARVCACGHREESIHSIKVLGSGCHSCHALYENCQDAVKELGLSVDVEYITDIQIIMSYGVMSMPALVINDKVMSMGKVLKVPDLIVMLNK